MAARWRRRGSGCGCVAAQRRRRGSGREGPAHRRRMLGSGRVRLPVVRWKGEEVRAGGDVLGGRGEVATAGGGGRGTLVRR